MPWSDLYGEHTLMAIRTDVRHPFDKDANGVALDLGELCVFVFEDPQDGYRSSASPVLIVKDNMYNFGCHPDYIHVPVLITKWSGDTEPDGIVMIDRRNDKTILILGTDTSDNYYPSFTCDWRPQNIAENSNKTP